MITSITDPVCWMDVGIDAVAGKTEYNGRVYCFCSLACKQIFDEKPDEYADASISLPPEPVRQKHRI